MKHLMFKLNIQLFADDHNPIGNSESELIKAVKEEYEKKLTDQKEKYENEISTMKKNHVEEVRALISGREENLSEEQKKKLQEKPKLSFKDQLLQDTREKLGLKGGK